VVVEKKFEYRIVFLTTTITSRKFDNPGVKNTLEFIAGEEKKPKAFWTEKGYVLKKINNLKTNRYRKKENFYE